MTTASLESKVVTGVLRGMLFIVWAIWAPVGFFLWIPLLLRTTLLFAGLVIHAVMTGQNPDGLRGHLENAIDFWFAGFRIARDTVFGRISPQTAPMQAKSDVIVIEVLWASTVWVVGMWWISPGVFADVYIGLSEIVQNTREGWILLVLSIAAAVFVTGIYVGRNRAPVASSNLGNRDKAATT